MRTLRNPSLGVGVFLVQSSITRKPPFLAAFRGTSPVFSTDLMQATSSGCKLSISSAIATSGDELCAGTVGAEDPDI